MAREKKPVHKVQMTDGKRKIIGNRHPKHTYSNTEIHATLKKTGCVT
ncbi:MAG: hypothetical protein R3Y09_08985 [Clostridia bacterium]